MGGGIGGLAAAGERENGRKRKGEVCVVTGRNPDGRAYSVDEIRANRDEALRTAGQVMP